MPQREREPSLFEFLEEERRRESGWRPATPPELKTWGVKRIALDTETTGLAWWETDRPIGAAVYWDGQGRYLPWGHGGGNLDPEMVRYWMQRELRGIEIINHNIKFDLHMLRVWGVDLEAQGCRVADTGHMAALLDDHRNRFSLDDLASDMLGERKIKGLDKTRMADYHAEAVEEYAVQDTRLVWQLYELMRPRLTAEGLDRVFDLECRCIWAVVEMEKNGSLIDTEKLDLWVIESQRRYEETLRQLQRMLGFPIAPNENASKVRIFEKLHLPLEYLESGAASFTDEILKRHAAVPEIALLRYAIKLASLRSKYLVKYQKALDSHGIMRYSLHQLKAQKDELSDYAGAGTVTGRFSSSEIIDGVGCNIQQVTKASKQRVSFGYEEEDDSHDDELFIIRALHIPPPGYQWLSADMMQVEYRIFASYLGDPKILEQYEKDPLTKFHDYMYARLKSYKPDLTKKRTKDLNFAYVYGAQVVKQALMLGHISASEYLHIKANRNYSDERLKPTYEIRRIYEQEVPGVEDLLALASHIAKPKCDKKCRPRDKYHAMEQHRGYVCTILGRRSRFPKGHRLHKAFNSIDQGSGADIMKMKLVDLYEQRHETGLIMCFTVHDEVDGYAPHLESELRVQTVLNRQTTRPYLRVPILWDVEVGPNWAKCSNLESTYTASEIKRELGVGVGGWACTCGAENFAHAVDCRRCGRLNGW